MITSKERRFIPSFVLSSLVIGITAPYLSILLRDLGYSPVWVGILLGINSGSGIAGPIVMGYLADKTGNYRPMLLASCLLPALVAFPLIHWIHPAVSVILIAMMAFGLRSTVSLIDAITTIQSGKTGNYGKVRVWGSLAFVFATLYFQWTPFLKPNTAAHIGLWIFLTAIVSVIPILSLPGTFLRSGIEHRADTEAEPETEKATPVSPRFKISPYALGGFITIFLCSFSMSSVYT
ncbi:MAG: MFS transporter, partial [Treponema sp.]|nr:MFS transporter [Treponema sp.]